MIIRTEDILIDRVDRCVDAKELKGVIKEIGVDAFLALEYIPTAVICGDCDYFVCSRQYIGTYGEMPVYQDECVCSLGVDGDMDSVASPKYCVIIDTIIREIQDDKVNEGGL